VAVYAPVRAGERWALTLEADGGLSLVLQSGPPADNAALAFRESSAPRADARLQSPSPLVKSGENK